MTTATKPKLPKLAPGTLRRTVTPWPARPWACTDAWGTRSLAHILDACPARTLALVGGWDAANTPPRAYWLAPVSDGWTISDLSSDPPQATYRKGSRTVSVRMSAVWYGDASDRATIKAAHARLLSLLRGSFDPGATLMGTPARTGMDLLVRSLPAGPKAQRLPFEYPPLPREHAARLRRHVGQGRIERVALPDVTTAPDGLYVLDARWMYAACVRHLPIGPFTYDRQPDFEGYRPGWYHITFQVPQGWQHIGLLPVRELGADGRLHNRFPAEPDGATYNAWASADEVRLALEQGWTCAILARLLGQPNGTPGEDPARRWQDTLVELRAAVSRGCDSTGPLVAAALRNLLIGTVGYWWRDARAELHIVPPQTPVPDYAQDLTIYPDRWEYYTFRDLDTAQDAHQRPEWAAAVWGAARARVARAALQLPRRDLVWIRSDALITTRNPGWADTGKPGCFRLKRHIGGSVDIPADEAAYLALLGEREGAE